jgi:Cu+-exporting ATPase
VVAVVDGRDAVASSHAAARDPDGDAVAQAARHGAAVLEAVVARAAARSAWLVAGLAVATLGFWLGAGAGPAAALGAAAAVLLVACPAAVGGAAATVLLAATARAVALGARPAGPRVLERAARVDTVVLCRSAVVGARRVDAVHAAAGVDPDEALRLAGATSAAALGAATGTTAGTATAAAAPGSGPAGGHPVDAAVAREARARCGALPDVAEPDGYPGLGVRGVVTELRTGPDDAPRVIAHATLVGRVALLADHGIVLPPELTDAVERVHRAGATAVAVSWDGVARAVLEVAAPVRAGLPAAVRRLRGLGIAPVLLTGDDEGAAHGLATQLGIAEDDVRAQVRREDRAAVVAALRARGRTVAVVGGPDDTAALAAADVALVERPAGETPGGETQPGDTQPGDTQPGDTQPGDTRPGETRPHVALETLCLSHRAAGTVERVLTAAVAHHLAALPLAAAGLLPPPAAAALAAVHPVVLVVWAAGLRRAPRRGGRRNAD